MKLSDVNINDLSPVMRQYAEIKKEYPNELLFFRLGDFYEMFFEDALVCAKELELTLTGKVAGLNERIPMCGIPSVSLKQYLEKIVNKGYKAAICEQLEDPKSVKGIVKRGVVSVISKGSISDFELLDEFNENYIASLIEFKDSYLISYIDISVGKTYILKLDNDIESLIDEVINLNIKEIILKDNLNAKLISSLKTNTNVDINFSDEFLENPSLTFNLSELDYRSTLGVKHLLYYLEKKLLKTFENLTKPTIIDKNNFLALDPHSIRNLELFETIRLKERKNSLLGYLDMCKTSMGSRLLKHWIYYPLVDKKKIELRQEKITILNNEFILKDELLNLLDKVYDIERLSGKVVNGSVNARDFLQLSSSLVPLDEIKQIIKKLKFDYKINTHKSILKLLSDAIDENAPIFLKEGGLIKKGYNKELDELKSLRYNSKQVIASFENNLKEKTKIKNLKIGYNKVFGYYIEVSKSNIKDIKEEYGFERKQTLTNAERYISPLLKEEEEKILNAEEKINSLEFELFNQIKEIVTEEVLELNKTAKTLAEVDVLCSLSQCATKYNLVKPTLNDKKIINLIDSWHPVLEVLNKDSFVPNDCFMDNNSSTLLITGPNMSGKSTYMRQIAIITIMAQIGSFVPAKKADIAIVDKIFTRIGASDDLVGGESTFMVEMKEAKNAIANATEKSLILFDELGRGTATYDGLSIAKAILEYVSKEIKCFTLFSTHYHELTNIDKEFYNIKNVHVSAIEKDHELIFLYKVKDGSIDKSYGLHVAKLAGLNNDILKRARNLMAMYETSKTKKTKNEGVQLSLTLEKEKQNDILEKIKELNIYELTPLDAMNYLFRLKSEVEKKE